MASCWALYFRSKEAYSLWMINVLLAVEFLICVRRKLSSRFAIWITWVWIFQLIFFIWLTWLTFTIFQYPTLAFTIFHYLWLSFGYLSLSPTIFHYFHYLLAIFRYPIAIFWLYFTIPHYRLLYCGYLSLIWLIWLA